MHGTFLNRGRFGRVIFPALVSALIGGMWFAPVLAQEEKGPKAEKLFDSEDTLAVTLHAPWRDIVQKTKNPDPYPASIDFTDSLGKTHSIPLTVERRGITRQAVCKYPPIMLRFEKEAVKGTTFRGQKAIKMVTHCDKGDRWEQYYVKEMLAYQIYNLFTERSFRVRPLSITYADSKTGGKEDPRFAFLIEDDSDLAKRNDLQKIELKDIEPIQIESHDANLFSLFQLLISNADWSALTGPGEEKCCHNAKLIGNDPNKDIYVVPYDFDSSGMVDAHYAAPNEGVPIKSVTQRLYRGFCIHNPTLGTARKEYLDKEQQIYDLIRNEPRLSARFKKSLPLYLGEFFDILRDDAKYDKQVIQKCRK